MTEFEVGDIVEFVHAGVNSQAPPMEIYAEYLNKIFIVTGKHPGVVSSLISINSNESLRYVYSWRLKLLKKSKLAKLIYEY